MPDLHHAHLRHAYLLAAATTRFGRHEGRPALDLMAEAANAALAQSGLRRADIDGVLCGYATTFPHLMLATLLSEKLGLEPHYAHGMQMGGATGAAMVMLARELVRAGRCRRVLVVAGENRLTGQAVDASIQTLAQVGEADTEVPNGASVPAYYALLASRYMHHTGTRREDLAELLCQIGGAVESVLGCPIEEEDLPKLIGFLKRQETNGKFFSKAMQKEPFTDMEEV